MGLGQTIRDNLRDIVMGRACGTHEAVEKYIRRSVEKPEEKRVLWKTRI